MRKTAFWVLAILALVLPLNPVFGGIILAGGFAEGMVAKWGEVW